MFQKIEKINICYFLFIYNNEKILKILTTIFEFISLYLDIWDIGVQEFIM
jgi:hypothetical protein